MSTAVRDRPASELASDIVRVQILEGPRAGEFVHVSLNSQEWTPEELEQVEAALADLKQALDGLRGESQTLKLEVKDFRESL